MTRICARFTGGIVIDAGRLNDVYRSSEYIFVMISIREALYANMRPRSNGGRKQIGMLSVARACVRGLSSTLSRPSIINQRILASRRIYCDARVNRTHETEIDAVPGWWYYGYFARSPFNTDFFCSLRLIKSQVDEYKYLNGIFINGVLKFRKLNYLFYTFDRI